MKNFNWEEFKNREIAVHCDTEEKANDFLKECNKQGITWTNGEKTTEINCWFWYEKDTSYACSEGKSKLTFEFLKHYKDKGLETIKWEIDKMKELTFKEVIADIKEGEVWENNKMNLVIKLIEGRIYIGDRYDNEVDGFIGQYIPLTLKFELQRKKYSFEEAFKAYEEGKEIESCEGCKFKRCDKDVVLIIDFAGDKIKRGSCEELFSIKEIRGKWYIND